MKHDTITLIAGILLKFGPATAKAIYDLFHTPASEITAEKWNVVFATADKEYSEYVPKTKLPAIEVPQTSE